jgi:Ala-tRNA(Pro) deacylase
MTDAPPPATEADLTARLGALGIHPVRHAHPPLFTVEQSQALRGALPGAHTKNLFLREKKGGHLLVCCLEDRAMRVKDVARAAGAKRAQLCVRGGFVRHARGASRIGHAVRPDQ